MALSAQNKHRLLIALGYRPALEQEFENALFVPAQLSLALKRNITVAMAGNQAANELINALQTGTQVLSPATVKRFINMMGNVAAANPFLPLLTFSAGGVLALLGPATTYSTFAAQINNTGTSLLQGNVGVSTGTVTGSPTVSGGVINAGNTSAAAALAAIAATYANLAGKTGGTVLTGQNLGGKTLTAGVYTYAGAAALTGTLTFDAQNNPNAVFIIQVGTALTTAANAQVVLLNGATSQNVYWQVGSNATLGADTAFAGTILALDNITLGAGASNNGALLAQTGTLTLNTNIVSPAPVNPAVVPPTPLSLVVTPGNTFTTPVWAASVGATSYNLYFNTTGAPTKLSTKITGAMSGVNITGLTNGTTYYYVVTAQNAAGESAISTASSATPTASAVATPTFSPVAGTYTGTQTVTISTATSGATLYYTTDGSTPTVFSTLYSGPVSVLVSETLKAIGIKSGLANSAVATAAYTINHAGPAPVNLGTAGTYRILTQAGITNASSATVNGDMGVSPIASTAITGFSLVLDGSGTFSTSALVTGGGKVYAADYTSPTPANLTTAIGDSNAAYTDAAGRTTPDFTNLGAGNLGGLTLAPGLYKWTSAVTIPTNVTLNGGASDVWIMQIAGTLGLATSTSVLLTGGAVASNVFWQVSGAVTLGTSSVMNGIILGATAINVGATATVHGRLYAGTSATLISGTVAA